MRLKGLFRGGLLLVALLGASQVSLGQTSASCSIAYSVVSQWNTGFQGDMKITNAGSAVTSWTLTWAFPSGQAITQLWNGVAAQSGAAVTVNNASFDGSLGMGDTVDVGFTASWSGSNTAPAAFSLNGAACSVNGGTAPPPPPPPPPPPTGCTTPTIPSFASLPMNAFLPDPFTFQNGTKVTTKAQWTCRQAEIAALAQAFEYGAEPTPPSSASTGSFSANTLTVTVNDNGKTISFAAPITYPSSGTGPFPALIGVGGSSLNNSALASLGVAIINLPNDDIAQQNNSSSRGIGKFYTMYGSGHSAGAMMAWAWGASRLIDALQKTPAARIDTNRLGVTGCSRNGKGALVVGAFEPRIKLTIPQESGSGGSGTWRVSDFMLSQGQSTQTLSEITGENVWFRADFSQFNSSATRLPFDHHSLEGLVSPRALLVIENNILWLGPQSSWTGANAAHMIWQALGASDSMGYSLTDTHNHCAFPASQQPEVTAYVQKFLVGGGTANTNIMRNDIGVPFNQAQWVNWTAPTLN